MKTTFLDHDLICHDLAVQAASKSGLLREHQLFTSLFTVTSKYFRILIRSTFTSYTATNTSDNFVASQGNAVSLCFEAGAREREASWKARFASCDQ
jgi:hypothetical protein